MSSDDEQYIDGADTAAVDPVDEVATPSAEDGNAAATSALRENISRKGTNRFSFCLLSYDR